MPDLPLAVRERSLAALEVADLRLLPALRRVLALVFDTVLERLDETYVPDTSLVAADHPGQRHGKGGKYVAGGSAGGSVKAQEEAFTSVLRGEARKGGHTDQADLETLLSELIDKSGSANEGLLWAKYGRRLAKLYDDDYDAFNKETSRVIRAVKKSQSLQAITAAVSVDDLDGMESAWREQVETEIHPIVAQLYEDTAKDAFAILAPTDVLTFRVSDPAFAEFMETAGRRIADIGESIWADLRSSLAEGIAHGESQRDLVERVREKLLVARTRAETIARTEARAARNGGAMAGARALGEHAPQYKQWIATLDGRTRFSHAAADGQVVPLEDRFHVGGHALDFPGDPSGPAEEVVNCRCRWIAVEQPDQEIAYRGRQMEVTPRVRAAKRGAYREVLREAERLGLTAADHPGQAHGKGGRYLPKASAEVVKAAPSQGLSAPGNDTPVPAHIGAILDTWVQQGGSERVSAADKARLGRAAIEHGEKCPQPLVRGANVSGDPAKVYAPGKPVILTPASFSTDIENAMPYAENGSGAKVLFHLPPGQTGLNVSERAGTKAGFWEGEWVVSSSFYSQRRPYTDDEGFVHVHLATTLPGTYAASLLAADRPGQVHGKGGKYVSAGGVKPPPKVEPPKGTTTEETVIGHETSVDLPAKEVQPGDKFWTPQDPGQQAMLKQYTVERVEKVGRDLHVYVEGDKSPWEFSPQKKLSVNKAIRVQRAVQSSGGWGSSRDAMPVRYNLAPASAPEKAGLAMRARAATLAVAVFADHPGQKHGAGGRYVSKGAKSSEPAKKDPARKGGPREVITGQKITSVGVGKRIPPTAGENRTYGRDMETIKEGKPGKDLENAKRRAAEHQKRYPHYTKGDPKVTAPPKKAGPPKELGRGLAGPNSKIVKLPSGGSAQIVVRDRVPSKVADNHNLTEALASPGSRLMEVRKGRTHVGYVVEHTPTSGRSKKKHYIPVEKDGSTVGATIGVADLGQAVQFIFDGLQAAVLAVQTFAQVHDPKTGRYVPKTGGSGGSAAKSGGSAAKAVKPKKVAVKGATLTAEQKREKQLAQLAQARQVAAEKRAAGTIKKSEPKPKNPKVLTDDPTKTGERNWTERFHEDTGWEKSVPVKNFTVEPGRLIRNEDGSFTTIPPYVVKEGHVFRVDGKAYLVETMTTISDKGLVRDRAREVAKHQHKMFKDNVPEPLRKYQDGFTLLAHDSPADPYWGQRYGIAHFQSNASAGDGTTHVYSGLAHSGQFTKGSMLHELGHNIDFGDGRGMGSNALSHHANWNTAASWDRPSKTVSTTSFYSGHPITPGTHAVTTYGGVHIHEDFAESVRMYLLDVASPGRYFKDQNGSPLRFGDIWPNRATFLAGKLGISPNYVPSINDSR